MGDELKQALTAEEWEAWYADREWRWGGRVFRPYRRGTSEEDPECQETAFDWEAPAVDEYPPEVEGETTETVYLPWRLSVYGGDNPHSIPAPDLPTLIALANDVLPDDYPGKLTHEIADAIDAAADLLQEAHPDGDTLSIPILRRASTAIRAILPPTE